MRNLKAVTVVGARPQFIKASVVSHALREYGALSEILVHTGQHFDNNMSDVFFKELAIEPPRYHLGIHGGTHGAMTGQMLSEIERVFLKENPDLVIVYGDTNSTLAGALAAVKLHIPVAHVEAGLRSFNMSMPEEVNRILTDRISTWLFTPTTVATQHLIREGVDQQQIVCVGDVMYDVALSHGARVSSDCGLLRHLNLKPKQYMLATIHRAENTDDFARLTTIFDALLLVSELLPVVLPLHPRTRSLLNRYGRLAEFEDKVKIIEPVGYLDMVQLEKFSALIATDSGGVQKEAFFHQVPCVTMREETEWVELVSSGWNRLAPPTDSGLLLNAFRDALNTRGQEVQPYGNGLAAVRIVEYLGASLGKRRI